jgi:thioredoxin domain-containing protein 10
MKITRGNLHQAFASNKYLVLAVVEENKLQDIPSHMIE